MSKLSAEQVSDALHKAGYNTAQVMKFLAWCRSAPLVWVEFQRITLDLIQRGKKAGAIDVLGRIRWEAEIEGGKDYKCNNNFAPYLARIFAAKYPQHSNYFEFRNVGES